MANFYNRLLTTVFSRRYLRHIISKMITSYLNMDVKPTVEASCILNTPQKMYNIHKINMLQLHTDLSPSCNYINCMTLSKRETELSSGDISPLIVSKEI
jgi:hypothetical protein